MYINEKRKIEDYTKIMKQRMVIAQANGSTFSANSPM